MRKQLLSTLAVVLPMAAAASTQWTIQGNEYQVDTLYHATVGPGTTHTSLKLDGASPLRVFYTTIDLTNPNIELRTVQATSKLTGTNTISGMANATKSANCHVVSGVNADFFGNSQPCGTTVVNGDYYFASNNSWSHWAIDADKVPAVADMTFSGTVTTAGGTSHSLAGINRARGENNLVIFNAHYGANTGTNSFGTEVSATVVSGEIAPGKTAELLIGCDTASTGSMTIPAGGVVLSGHGTAAEFLSSLKQGDKVTVGTTIKANGKSIEARQVAGGRPLILSDGKVLETQGALDHLTALNPRTAIGYDATGTKLVLLVVDGRSTISKGCVSKALAEIMLATGCTEAMNFDGGGSSTMYVGNLGVRNVPSDGKERAVVNGVFAVSPTPTDNVIASIEFEDHAIVLPKYGIYRPKINAFNRYGVWLADAEFEVELSCDEALGTITEDGALLASGEGLHALTAKVGDLTAKIPVTIGTAAPEFKRSEILLDGFYEYPVEVQSLVGQAMMSVANQALAWNSEDPSIATVDDEGVVRGVKTGVTTVTGTVGDVTCRLTVNVEIPTEHYVVVDSMNDIAKWTVTTTNVKNVAATPDADGEGMTVNFTVSNTRIPSISLARDITLWSRPAAMELEINPGDSALTELTITYVCDGGRNNSVKVELNGLANQDSVVRVNWAEQFALDTPESYPLVIKKLQFSTAKTSGASYTVHFGAIKAYYENIADGAGVADILGDSTDGAIDLSQPADYYNLQGVKVAQPAVGGLYIVKQGGKVAKVVIR